MWCLSIGGGDHCRGDCDGGKGNCDVTEEVVGESVGSAGANN